MGRNQIAKDLDISQGSVSNILGAFKRGVEEGEYESIREFVIHCKKEGFSSIADFKQALRIKSYLERLGLDVRDKEDAIENFISSLAIQPDPAKLIEVAGRLANSNSDLPLDELEEQINTKRAERDVLETQKEALLTEIEERRRTLDADKKAAEDFLVVKEEMDKCGISGPDSTRFLSVIHTFQKYGYDPSKIMNAFAEVIEVQDINRLKLEVENNQHVLDTRLEELGLGDFEQLRQVIAALMTLENFGISQEKIIGLCRNLDLSRLRRQEWQRGREWGNWTQENNGGQEYGYAGYSF